MGRTPTGPADLLHLHDDFYSNDSVADAAVGELNWEIVTIANASTYANLVTTNVTDGKYGVLRSTTNGTADGDGSVLRLDEDVIVLGGNGGELRFSVRYPDITGNQLAGNDFRIGLQDSVTATEPTVGIWVFGDAGVVSLQADSGDHGDNSVSASGVDTFTSGSTMVLGTWHDFLVRWHGTNAQGGPKNVDLWVDGYFAGSTLCNIDNDEEMELSICHYQNSGGAATLELDVDYVDLRIFRAP